MKCTSSNKKLPIFFLLVVIMALLVSGCDKTGECEGCHQTEKLQKYVEEDGDIHWYCDDCYKFEKMFGW